MRDRLKTKLEDLIQKLENLVRDLKNNLKKRWALIASLFSIVFVAVLTISLLAVLLLNGWMEGAFWTAYLTMVLLAPAIFLGIIRFRWRFVLIIAAINATVGIMWIIWGIQIPSETQMPSETQIQENYSVFGTRLTLTVGAIGAAVLSTVGILNLIANNRRADIAERQQAQELFVNSIKNLGSREEIIRIGAIHGLGQLAKDSPEVWKDKVATILCGYIRSTTQESDYQTKYKDEPSVEVSTMLEILTSPDRNPFDSTKFDLSGAYLVKANLRDKILVGANMGGTNLFRANLIDANLIGATLYRANLANSYLTWSNLTGANLDLATLTDAHVRGANMQCAGLFKADLKGATLDGAKLEGSFSDFNVWKPLQHILKERVGEKADLTALILGLGSTNLKLSLKGVSCGAFTQGLYDAVLKDLGTGETKNEDSYREKYSFRRPPTQDEKEDLVGTYKVGDCEWSDIVVLEDKD